jgi:lipopolysaccharide/colanic/teichoic acid biosynthesis glycosyltransferase
MFRFRREPQAFGARAPRLAGRTILVTGASGAIGRHLSPWLSAHGARVVAASRNPLKAGPPLAGLELCSSNAVSARLQRGDIDAIVDLAVVNSDATADAEVVRAVNQERPRCLAEYAREHGVRRFVVLSSYHAYDPDNHSPYADSKRALERWAKTEEASFCRVVVMPKILSGSAESGPTRLLLRALAILKPAAFFEDAAHAIARALEAGDAEPGPFWVESAASRRVYAAISRTLDIIFALGLFVGLGWLMILLLAAIRLDSKGPAIFRQVRVGRSEQPFVLYKFRTMAVGTPEAGTHEIGVAAVTRLGRFLRRTKLDELPQAWNMLRGEVALIGPRPCLPNQIDLVAERRARAIFSLRPGLTGLAQVNGIDMRNPRELACWEANYMRIRGLLLDLRIVWQTFVGRGGGDRISA